MGLKMGCVREGKIRVGVLTGPGVFFDPNGVISF